MAQFLLPVPSPQLPVLTHPPSDPYSVYIYIYIYRGRERERERERERVRRSVYEGGEEERGGGRGGAGGGDIQSVYEGGEGREEVLTGY